MENRVQTARNELNTAIKELLGLNNNIDSAKGNLDALQTNIQQFLEREVALKIEVVSLTDRIRRLTSDINANKTMLAEMGKQRDRLDKDIAAKHAEKTLLQTEIYELDSRVAELRARRNALLQQIAALQKQIETKQDQRVDPPNGDTVRQGAHEAA